MKKFFYLLILPFIVISCTDATTTIEEPGETFNWIVPVSQIQGELNIFPLMNTPEFKTVSEITELRDTSKVAIVSFKNEVRVYPYRYTNYYEIVNDVFDGKSIGVSYCPITKSAICFNREIGNKVYDLIASGFLYKDNMVPSDANFEFFYSQMLMLGIKGEFASTPLRSYNLIETQWKTVKDYFQDAKVFFSEGPEPKSSVAFKSSTVPGIADFLYGVSNTKIDETIELFSYDNFAGDVQGLTLQVNSGEVLVIGNKEKKFFTSYVQPLDRTLTLLAQEEFPNIISDNLGNVYNLFGYAISGPNQGEQLDSPKAFVAQYWAWDDFYANLHEQE